MYADRLEAEAKPSIKHRLNVDVIGNSIRRRTFSGKRQRQDDKWEHDLYEDDQPHICRKLGGRDLRLKLQRKSSREDSHGARHDLREKLSGSMHSQLAEDVSKPKIEPEAFKPIRSVVIAKAPTEETDNVFNSKSKRNTQQKSASLDGFLRSLDLEKYLISFQAEEVDMAALEQMTGEDLKAMGIPMGPRKKILLALDSGADIVD